MASFQKPTKFLLKNQIKILECHNTYPLRKNLIPEISAVPQISVDALSEENPLFPKLLRFRCGCSTELWKIWWSSVGFSFQTPLIFLLGVPNKWGLAARQCSHGILASLVCLRTSLIERRGTRRECQTSLRVSLAGRLQCLFMPLCRMVQWILVLTFL